MILDYHTHLRGLSESGEGPVEHTPAAVERFAQAAATAGVDEIGFTEHLYYFREFDELVKHPYQRDRLGHDIDRYCEAVLEGKRRGLPVKLGLEVEWFGGAEAELTEILAGYPWDYLLGSVHLLEGEAIDLEPGLWELLTVEEIWRRYFAALGELAASGLVDVLAHPDLVKIFGRRPAPQVVAELHEEAAESIQAAGIAIEVSTAGLRKCVAELYPDEAFLLACRRRGIPVTTASDAHVAQDVGRDLGRAVELLRRAGYETVTVFEGRERRQERLG